MDPEPTDDADQADDRPRFVLAAEPVDPVELRCGVTVHVPPEE